MPEGNRTVHKRVPYVHDREIHVSTVEASDGGVFFDLREFIPSLGEYGRGITLDAYKALPEVYDGIETAWESLGLDDVPGLDEDSTMAFQHAGRADEDEEEDAEDGN